MSEYVRCVGCGEIVEATEPCSCVFDVVGTLDAQGVLHTAERVAVEWTEEALDAAVAYMDEVEERAALEAERAAEWAVQQFVSQYGRDWPDEGDRMEMAYRRINRADPNYEPVYSREQAARQDLFDMAKGKMPRAFR